MPGIKFARFRLKTNSRTSSKRVFACFLHLIALASGLEAQNSAKLVIPVGHTAGINAVDCSADGLYFVTGSLDQRVKIWESSGLEVQTLAGHTKNVRAVSFSPAKDADHGLRILSGGSDHVVILWNELGNQLGRFADTDETGEITSVAFAPDGRQMLAGSKSGKAWLLDQQCKPILSLPHAGEVNAVAFSPKDNLILTACADKTAILWKSNDATSPLRTLSGHKSPVLSAVFSVSGDTILTGSADGTAILWKLNGEKIRTFQHSGTVQSVALSPNGKWAASGASDGSVKVWNLTNQELKSFQVFDRGLRSIKFSADGQSLLVCSEAHAMVKIVPLDGKALKSLQGHTSAITAMTISPDGANLLVAHADSTAKIWELSSQQVKSLTFPGKLESVAFVPVNESVAKNGPFILTGCEDKFCRIQDLQGLAAGKPIPAGNRAVSAPDGSAVLTGNSDGTVNYWTLPLHDPIPLGRPVRSVTALAFSPVPGSKAFAVGGSEGELVYWDSLKAKPVSIQLSMPMPVYALAFSPDGKNIVCGEEGGLTEIRDLSGNLIKTYPNRRRGTQNVNAVLYTLPNAQDKQGGRYVLRASANQIERWEPAKARVDTFSGHTSPVVALALTPDGNTFFSGSEDGTVKLWDLGSGKEIATLVSLNANDWAVTTPSGLNDASEGAMKIMHYTAGLTLISLKQIQETYAEPGLLAKVTGFSSDSIHNVSRIDTLSLFPEVEMRLEGSKLRVSLKERNGGIGKLSLFINKKRVADDLNPMDANGKRLKVLPPIDLEKYNNMFRSDTVNTIKLVSYDRDNVLRSQPYERLYKLSNARGDEDEAPQRNNCATAEPNVYIISVGTSKYDSLSLTYPDQDAAAMADALGNIGRAMRGPDHVFVKQLSTNPGNGVILANKTNIHEAFMDFAAKSGPCDILIAYFSGHGKNWAPEGQRPGFYYLTTGISTGKIRNEALRKAHAISDDELEEWLNQIPAEKQVMILDACHAGTAVNNIKLKGIGQKATNVNQKLALSLLNNRTGAWILSGSTADMRSYEASKFGQGLLTYSLLEAMNGSALMDNKFVDVSTMFNYATNQVPVLAASIGEKQTPVTMGSGASFPIGVQDGTVKIQLPQEKPVFIPSKFSQPAPKIRDEIKLGEALNNYFYEERLQGKNARFVYYETPSILDQAFRIEGVYEEKAGVVTVTCNLYQGLDRLTGDSFQVAGSSDTRDLVPKIWAGIKARLPKK